MRQLRTADKDHWRYSSLKRMVPWYSQLSTSPLAESVSEEFKELFDVDTFPDGVYQKMRSRLNYEL